MDAAQVSRALPGAPRRPIDRTLRGVRRRQLVGGLVIAIAGCAAPDAAPPPSDDSAAAGGGTAHEYAYLEDEVQHLLGFLRGNEALRPEVLADSVVLYVAPEGGGEVRRLARHELVNREAWRAGAHSLVPPAGLTDTRLTPGLHSNCQPADLESRYPELARYPHVGVRLAPGEGAACLQTWNATFVFSDDAADPRLTGVVYDQWEW